MTTSQPHAIQGGTNDTTHQFAVGIVIQMSGGTALCSGALLAPNLVATARHCVAAIPASGIVTCPDTKFGAVTSASNIVVSINANLSDPSAQAVAAKKVIVPSGANQTAVCGNDIALLILSQNITLPTYVTPVLNPPMTDHTRYSTTVTAIGYGITSATDPTGDTAGTRRIKQNVKLTCIPGDPMFANCYPSPDNSMTMAEFSSGNGTCEGDSGSDAYEQDNFNSGRWVGFGVLSRGGDSGSTCLGGIYTRFDAWSSLIIDAATQAAASGGYDVPSWAMPGGGADASTDGAVDAGMPPADASIDLGMPGDGATTADAARDGAGGSGGSPGRDAGAGTGGAGGMMGAVDAGGAMDMGGGSGGSTTVSDAGAAQDGKADSSVPDSGSTADLHAPDDGNANGPDGGIPIDAGSDADAGNAPSDAGMTPDGASDGNSGKGSDAGKDGGSQNTGATSNVTSSLGCSCATGGGAGASPGSMLVALGLGLGLVLGRPRRRGR